MKKGIMFHPRSPYFKICADVVVQNVTVVKDHTHSIPSTSSSSSRMTDFNFEIASFLRRLLYSAPLQTQPSTVSP